MLNDTSADRGTARLSGLIAEARARAASTGRPVLVSLAEPAPRTDPLEALEALRQAAKRDEELGARVLDWRMFWSRPGGDLQLGGAGAVASLTASGADRFAQVDRAWQALRGAAVVEDPSGGAPGVGPVLMGGFSFDPDGPRSGLWEGFPAALLVVPRILVSVVHGDCWVTTSLLVGADGEPDVAPALLARLRALALDAAPAPRLAGPQPGELAFADVHPAADWQAAVADAAAAIRRGEAAKVVLARSVQATAPHDLDVAGALRQLRADLPECHVFAAWRRGRAFVGASPERLVRLDGREVRSSSLAGSIGRGATPHEDAGNVRALLASAKDRAEHEMVREALRDTLADMCDELAVAGEPEILTLPHVHHLHTPMRARLRPAHSLLDVVGRLHPTPAVGGAPREAALRYLREREPLDRGWYAAPVGWLGAGHGEFAVALRSALVSGNRAWLFAGCGVMADSDPRREFEESLLKLRPMQLALAAACAGAGASGSPAHRRAVVGDGAR